MSERNNEITPTKWSYHAAEWKHDVTACHLDTYEDAREGVLPCQLGPRSSVWIDRPDLSIKVRAGHDGQRAAYQVLRFNHIQDQK